MIPHLCLCCLQSCNKSLINQACSGPCWENIGPRSFLYGPRCARSVLSRPRANILPVRPSRLVNKIYLFFFLKYLCSLYYLEIISEKLCLAIERHCNEKTTHIQEQPAKRFALRSKISILLRVDDFCLNLALRPTQTGSVLHEANFSLATLYRYCQKAIAYQNDVQFLFRSSLLHFNST